MQKSNDDVFYAGSPHTPCEPKRGRIRCAWLGPAESGFLCLDKGKGLKYRALGLRPFPGLGQKKDKKKNDCFGVVRRDFGIGSWIPTQFVYSLFHGNNVFLPNPCFCLVMWVEKMKKTTLVLHIFKAQFLRPLPFSRRERLVA